MSINDERATRIGVVLKRYNELVEDDDPDSYEDGTDNARGFREDCLSHLVTDIQHYCEQKGLDWESILQTAEADYANEMREAREGTQ